MNATFNIDGSPFYAEQAESTDEGGFEPLGTNGSRVVFFSLLHKRVFNLAASELKEMNLKAMLGADWCSDIYGEYNEKKGETVFNHKQLATNIISTCQAEGPYSISKERRTGIWKMDDGQLIVNSKTLWRPSGLALKHGIIENYVYPVSGDIGFSLATEPATNVDIQRVLTSFRSLQWNTPLSSEMLLGWVGVAILASAVKRRPHVMLTGPAGCGKSTMLEQVRWLLGDMMSSCTGGQTLMGLNQLVQEQPARAIGIDEFEADSRNDKCRQTLEAARSSYSLTEGDEGIVRGTPGGNAKCYRLSSPFIAAGISPGKMEPADRSRWVVLESRKLEAGGSGLGQLMSEDEASAIGKRLCRLFVSRWNVFQETAKIIRQVIVTSGGDGRISDTVGTLLAAYWAFISDKPATIFDATKLVAEMGLDARIAIHDVSDEKECLEALLTKVIPFRFQSGQYVLNRNLAVGEAVKLVSDDPTGQVDVVNRLAQLGIRVTFTKGKWFMYVANSPTHTEMRKLFSGTKWAHGGWGLMLRRLPGGAESTQRIGVQGAQKVTVFNLPESLYPANDEEMLLAA